jgi:F0F1-type ATP synthase membrane subunit b/b'
MGTYLYLLDLFTLSPEDPLMILVSMGLFLVLWKTIERSFFSHYMPLYEARLQATEGNLTVAETTAQQAAAIRSEVQAELQRARSQALEARARRIAEAKAVVEQQFSQAESGIIRELKQSRDRVEQEAVAIKKQLRNNIPQLVDTVVENLIN